MDWTKREDELIVADYFNMLQKELSHVKYVKTKHRLALLPLLENRTKGAVEFKHRNISTILAEMGLPYVKGYKPATNKQGLLEAEVNSYIKEHSLMLRQLFQQFADQAIPIQSYKSINFETIVEAEPAPLDIKEPKATYRPIKTNFLEREQNNRALGEGGEELVLDYERWRLRKAGKESLANKIRWVSKEMGDGLGYDILSKNEDGTDRYVEVKTTKLSKETPFYVTQTELSFAVDNAHLFYLYRVFSYGINPRFFVKQGEYEAFCKLEPITFRANLNKH